MAHLIPLKDDPKWSKDMAKRVVSTRWPFYRLPTDIVSHQDRRFYALWVEVCDLFNIHRTMYMGYYPEAERQTERVYQTLEHCLYAFRNFEMHSWSEMLTIA
jgi:hypothetical protein